MLYTYNNCLNKYGSDYKIKKAISNGELFLKEKGIYSDIETMSDLSLIAFKYPRAVFSGGSAYYYYGLTDVVPELFFLATKRDDTRIHDQTVKQLFVGDDLFNEEIVTINYRGTDIRIYSKERMLVDLIRFKGKMPYDYYKDIINSYRNIVNELDLFKAEDYASKLASGNRYMKAIELEVL